MTERDDDELLRRYRALGTEAPSASADAAILAASRRALRARPLPRWAVPVSIAAVLVLALGLVLEMQREAPDAGMPVQTRGAPASAPEPVEPAPPAPPAESVAPAAPAAPAAPVAPSAAARAPALQQRVEKSHAPAKAEAKHVAPAPRAAEARVQEAPAAGAAPQPAAPAVPASALDAASRANVAPAAAPQAAKRALAVDPLQRELERIARLREEGRQDEADAALAAFERAHPDYRIEPAMWDRVRRR